MSAPAAAPAHPAEHPPEAAHATQAVAPGAANDNTPVAKEQHDTAAAAKKAAKPHPALHPESHDESHDESHHTTPHAANDDSPKAAAPAAPHTEEQAEAGHHRKLLLPKWEGDGIKKVGKEAAKGAWTLIKSPVTLPIHFAAGITYGVLGKFYDGAVWTKNGAKWLWNRDTLYIPTVAKFLGGVVAYPFVKLWQGTKWVGKGLWENKTYPFVKLWEGTKWTGRKIKGIFVKPKPAPAAAPAAATHGTPAATPPAAAAHGTAAHAADAHAATPAAHGAPAAADAAHAAPHPAPAAPEHH